MRVSIALCTFNGGRHLREQLDSLLAQTRLPDELVIRDDASDDNTLAIAKAFAGTAPFPVRLDRNEQRLGPTGNFGTAISQCTGDVILPCDQDDVWLPTKVERQVEPFARDPAVTFSIVQSEVVDEHLQPMAGRTVFDSQRFGRGLQRAVAAGDGFSAFLRHTVAPGHASAFAARLRGAILPFPETCIFDQWIALVASGLGRTAMVEEPLVKYRMHASQAVGAEKSLAGWAVSQPKLDHLQRQLDTLNELSRRLPAYSAVQTERLAAIAARGKFLTARHAMRGSRLRRTALAMKLLGTGSYHRHGRGFLAFARDLRG